MLTTRVYFSARPSLVVNPPVAPSTHVWRHEPTYGADAVPGPGPHTRRTLPEVLGRRVLANTGGLVIIDLPDTGSRYVARSLP